VAVDHWFAEVALNDQVPQTPMLCTNYSSPSDRNFDGREHWWRKSDRRLLLKVLLFDCCDTTSLCYICLAYCTLQNLMDGCCKKGVDLLVVVACAGDRIGCIAVAVAGALA
jgi:hypothetical protein